MEERAQLETLTEDRLAELLREKEQRYGMKSEEFYEKWSRGRDDEDFFEWAAYCYFAISRASRVGVRPN